MMSQTESEVFSADQDGASNGSIVSFLLSLSIKTSICLFLALLTVERFFPNTAINVFGLISLSIYIYFSTIRKSAYLGFVFLIFVLAHFNYASNQGGIVNFAALLVLLAALITGKYQAKKDPLLLAAVGLMLMFNFAGYFFNPIAPFTDVAKGAAAFVAYILVFVFCSSLRFRLNNMGSIIAVLSFISFYSMVMALNYFLSVYVINTPIPFLTPSPERFGSSTIANMTGNSELYGEESLMFLAFCLPLLFAPKHVKSAYKVNMLIIIIVIMTSLAGLYLSRSRSVIILMIFMILIMPLLQNIAGLSAGAILRNTIITLVVLIGTSLVLWAVINIGYSFERFDNIDFFQLTTEGVISGEQINRGVLFEYGFNRLKSEPWFFGFGWLTYRYNMQCAVGPFSVFESIDLHSLYLTLPFLFGWIGSAAFLSIFFITLRRLWNIMRKAEMALNSWRVVALCFFLAILFFLLNEYKIGILREPHYFMTIWIWLGLSNSLCRSYKEAQ